MKKIVIGVILILIVAMIGFLSWSWCGPRLATFAEWVPQSTASQTTPAATTSMRHSARTLAGQMTPIRIQIGKQIFRAHLNNSVTAKAVLAKLPVTLTVQGLTTNPNEHTAALKRALPIKGTPTGADPAPGDIGYWAPGPSLILYWGDVDYFNGIHILGRFDQSDRQTAIRYIHQQQAPYQVIISRN
jgi:hypothetical protein